MTCMWKELYKWYLLFTLFSFLVMTIDWLCSAESGSPRWPNMTGPKGATTDGPSVAGCAFLLWATGGYLQWSPCGRYIGSLVGQCGMAIWGCRKSLQQWMTVSLCTSHVSSVTTRSRLQHSPDRPGSQLARQLCTSLCGHPACCPGLATATCPIPRTELDLANWSKKFHILSTEYCIR